MTDAEIEGCLDDAYDKDISDELYNHFEHTFGRWYWCDIGDEAQRIYELATGCEAEEGSLLNSLFNASAAQGEHGAYAAVAAALGLDAKALRMVVATWYENQDALPPPVSFSKLKKLIEKDKLWLKRLHEGEAK